ncbi:MAG: hypothetical protein EOO09_06680 [Chitinophagaceae bacterium]|nr:MAG: hypothetical protein EOO09_06680 [Chitinophagaceae bacterium]
MAANAKGKGIRRGEMAFIVAIVMGLVLGMLIKRVRLGLLLGLVVGSMIVFLGWISIKRRD